MATIIENNDPNPSRPVLISQDSSAGWAVAILVIVAAIFVAAFWYVRYYRAPSGSASTPGTTVQVNLPTSGYAPANTGASGSASGGTGTQAPAPTAPNSQ